MQDEGVRYADDHKIINFHFRRKYLNFAFCILHLAFGRQAVNQQFIVLRGGKMLGARIAALRRGRGLSQAQLAQRLKISPSAVGMYEQGRREPSAQLLVAMAAEFQVSTDFLLTGKASAMDTVDLEQLLEQRLLAAQQRLSRRADGLSSREMAVLLAAMLMET